MYGVIAFVIQSTLNSVSSVSSVSSVKNVNRVNSVHSVNVSASIFNLSQQNTTIADKSH